MTSGRNVQMSPTAYMVNSQQGDEISKAILSDTSVRRRSCRLRMRTPVRTWLVAGSSDGTSTVQPAVFRSRSRCIRTFAPGTIIGRTDRVPFPGSNIGSVVRGSGTLFDTMRFNYAAALQNGTLGGGPRFDYEIRSFETLVNRAPLAQAVVTNIG